MKILGCGCGDPDCSWATVRVEVVGDAVLWAQFRGSSPPAGEPGAHVYDDLGPYRFDRAAFAAALAAPRVARAAVRVKRDSAALRAGIPRDPHAWLKEMTLAFGPDFHTRFRPEAAEEVAAEGLRALADAGHPVTDEAVRGWARSRRFSEDAIERCVERFRSMRA